MKFILKNPCPLLCEEIKWRYVSLFYLGENYDSDKKLQEKYNNLTQGKKEKT